MAAVVRCDCCGEHVMHNNARHVRFYKMDSATSYLSKSATDTADVCDNCYHKLRQMLNLEVAVNADK